MKKIIWIIIIVCILVGFKKTYKYFVFMKIARGLTVNIEDDFHKAANVAFWVFDNIRPSFARGGNTYPMPVVDDNFLYIYRRGFGSCDQSAYVYSALMSAIGFEARMLMLKDSQGKFPHVVTVVKINGGDLIVDTHLRFIFSQETEPVQLEMLEDSSVFARYSEKYPRYKADWFKNGVYWDCFRTKRKYFKFINRILDTLR